ncbi:phosphoglycolate phosphatase, TA0175-type [[Bacillus] enclensis]|uniref:Phosphoglycolate phosphatase n=1 Tax=[Bacillus] enclensis TaxID=1402860 RepID=A0A0V8HP01_9BACI|nr:Cof-type HAD-IIB family hydrolase [[Bacillus] enclensis]OAT82150.1 phosphoglycolate phosphatase, TA0175-type [Bacillus sp. MKU004]QTC41878.1 HAD family phosphatase [Bacillus sp. V3]QWC23945.1 Cof-type HAD-IIB family hydrolase [Bacillus haikouensis]KSU64301.1 phosphoglycolate phosphatase, TA0175-type [[Bacillus] enclensis]MBH9966874.1 HAD family phosphatase [[Bacillus] enclensis]
MTIKLIALDMDGTLVNHEGEVSPENEKAIQRAKEKGIHVVLSTGRSLRNCRDISDQLGRSSYLITVNGGEIYDHEYNLVDSTHLDTKLVKALWALKEKHDVYFWSSTTQGIFNTQNPFDQEIDAYNWLKFGFDIQDDEVRKVVMDELLKNEALEITNSSPTNIEINPAGVNKAAALVKVCERLDLSMEEVMAVGDSMNDIAMIRESGFGVAMGNAQEAVKEAADWVTGINTDHGVAQAIDKVLAAVESK